MITRLLQAAVGEDGTAHVWRNLTPDGWQVVRWAHVESRELGHPCLAGEHLLLGVLRHGDGSAAALLRAHGLDLADARTDLERIGYSFASRPAPDDALRAVGIDVGEVRRRLAETFGPHALQRAERRVRRRPTWRGGHDRPYPICTHVLVRRPLRLAAKIARRKGIGPSELLHGVLVDARDPLGTEVSRRVRRQLAPYGFAPGRTTPSQHSSTSAASTPRR